MNLTQRQKRMLQWLGYPFLALMVFLFAVQLTFPYERVKDRVIELLRDRYEVSIVSVAPTFLPGGMILETVVLQTRPTEPDEEPTTVFIDRLRIDLGLFGLLRGRADVDITAEIGGGSIDGNVVVGSKGLEVSFATEGLPLENIPGLRGAVGLPMKGGLDASVDLRLPEQRWDLAEGTIALACSGCTVGDGVAKIKPRGPEAGARQGALFASQGMTVPELRLGTMAGKIVIGEGQGTIEQLTASSDDGDLVMNGAIRFGRELADSEFERGCMKFRLSDELKQREPNFGNLPMLMGVALQEDGYANLMMRGKLATMRWLPAMSCDDDGSSERVGRRTAASRPSIPTQMEARGAFGGSPERGEDRAGRIGDMEMGGMENEEGDEIRPETPTPPPYFDTNRGEMSPGITPVPNPGSGWEGREDDVRLREDNGVVITPPPGPRRRVQADERIGRELEDDDDGEMDESATRRREWQRGQQNRYEEYDDDEEKLEDEGEFE